MKKFLNYVPHIIFAGMLLVVGAFGNLGGSHSAIEMFRQIALFNQPESFGRILVGLGQVVAAIGIFFEPTRRIAASLGIVIMLGAIFFEATVFGIISVGAVVTLIAGVWILFMGYGCRKCANGVCTECALED